MWAKLKQQLWEWRGVWITAPSVAALLLLLRAAGALQFLEWATLDQFFRLRPPEPQDSRIVIVGISEPDLKALGTWPLPDGTLAKVLETIKQQQPRAIGLDLYRNFPVEPGHQALVQVFKTTPNLIGIQKKIEDGSQSTVPAPPVLDQLGQVAANDVVVDQDGKIRRAMMYVTPDNEDAIPSLGLSLALIYLEKEQVTPQESAVNPDYLQLKRGVFRIFESNDGGYVRADARSYQVLLNYRGPAKTFQTIPLRDVLANRIPPQLMRDRIVLIGATAISLNDFFYTPYSGTARTQQTAGVEIQANLTSQILSAALDGRPQLYVWSEPIEIAWVVLWSYIGAILSWRLRSPRFTTLAIVLTGGLLLGGCYLAFLWGWWLPVAPAGLALVGSAVVLTGYISSLEQEERQVMMNLFGRHVTPEIAEAIWQDRDQLLEQGRIPGRKLTATVLFTDLKDFSTIAEQTEPEELMLWLNEYMEAMVQIVLDHGGVIDKFIGDAVMAVFGVPIPRTTEEAIAQDAYQAVSCALVMAERLKSLNQTWLTQGRPTATMRVGISTGAVVTGSLGGAQRMDYTTIGDSVNVAARLESYDKSIEGGICRVLISEATYLKTEGKFLTQPIGSVFLKGREQPIEIHQVLGT